MYLLYLDASGTPQLQDRTKHYVIVGLCMHESSWFPLNDRILALKNHYSMPGSDPDEFKIHVKQFAVGIPEQDRISGFEQMSRPERRVRVLQFRAEKLAAETTKTGREKRTAKYRETDPFIHLTRAERSQLLEDAIDIIAGHEQLRLFGEAISKAHPAVIEGYVSPIKQGFTQVVVRFDTFLQKKSLWERAGDPRRTIDHGLLMLDRDESTREIVEPLFGQFRSQGQPFGELRHVIDVPFFGVSAKFGGLQLADVASYVVRRYLDQGAIAGSHEERHFMKLFQRFDRDTYGNLHGLRHYVPINTCDCAICRARGHSVAYGTR